VRASAHATRQFRMAALAIDVRTIGMLKRVVRDQHTTPRLA
jgi:hypothetical protein